MFPSSLRFRLPLSYASIALLVALALSVVLPIPVRNYYGDLESQYLNGNAQAIALAIQATREVSGVNWMDVFRQSQLQQLSFLSQARVQVLNTDEQVIADSGPAKPRSVSFMRVMIASQSGSVPLGTFSTAVSLTEPLPFTIYINSNGMAGAQITSSLPMTRERELTIFREGKPLSQTVPSDMLYSLSVVGTPFGFGLGDQMALDSRRSSQVVRYPLQEPGGTLWGFVQLSEGPSYGGQIVDSLTRGLFIAGAVAVLLAIGVGLLISRYINAPLMKLTDVTARMSSGDLSARANVSRQDELGTLASSFNEMAMRVEETILTLRSFVADAAHELNTPLTALRTYLELVAEENDSGSRTRFIGQAQAQLDRLQALAAGLLDLSRAEGGVTRQSVELNLSALVQEVGEAFASRAEQAGVSFSLDAPEEPICCTGDASQLQHALANLLDNALKFTPSGGLVALRLACEGHWAVVNVEDTGIGIPPEDIPRVFSRFHRGRNAAGYPGSGLGLAIVKAIVERHGGQVQLTSDTRGTCVTLQLPVCGVPH